MLNDLVFRIAVTARHGPRQAAQDVDRRVAAALGNSAVKHDMAIQNSAHRVGDRLVVIVAFDEDRKQASDCSLAGARARAFQEFW